MMNGRMVVYRIIGRHAALIETAAVGIKHDIGAAAIRARLFHLRRLLQIRL
jgi:hypothetical protein